MLAARTGLVLDPYFSAPKMTWLRRNVTTEGVVTTTDSWLVHQLCGEFVTDASTASRSLLLDIDRVDWDDRCWRCSDSQRRAAAADRRLRRIVGTTTAFGDADRPSAGWSSTSRPRCWRRDAGSPAMAKCTFGTGAFLLANTGQRAVRSTAGLTSSVAWRTARPDRVLRRRAGLHRRVGGALADRHGVHQPTPQRPGPHSPTTTPAGCSACRRWPGWPHRGGVADATATFAGITLATRPGHLVVALLQGIAAQVAELTDVIAPDLGQPLRSLRVDGGLTRSTAADAIRRRPRPQLPVGLYPSPHATALGAAALGTDGARPSARARRRGARLEPAQPPTSPAGPPTEPTFRERWRPPRPPTSRRPARHDTTNARQPPPERRLRRGGHRRRHRRRRDRSRARRQPARRSRCWRPAATSATAPARPTPRCCTPAMTPPRHAGEPAGAARVSSCSATTPARPASRSNAPARCWSPGTDEQLDALPGLKDKAAETAATRCEIIDADEVYRELPDLGPGALGRADRPRRVDHLHLDDHRSRSRPTPAARRRAAARAPRRPRRGRSPEHTILHDHRRDRPRPLRRQRRRPARRHRRRTVRTSAVHRHPASRRAAGVRQARPRRWSTRSCSPVPTKLGKGVLISPTIYGNVMLGPTAEDLEDKTATGTSEAGFEFLLEKGRGLMPELLRRGGHRDVCRPARDDRPCRLPDRVRSRPALRARRRDPLHRADLRDGASPSTSPNSSPTTGLDAHPQRTDLPDPPQMPNLGEAFPRPYQKPNGSPPTRPTARIVCFCERVTAGEIRDALRSPIPPGDLDGLRRRTRAMNGRCQGFFCGADVQAARRPLPRDHDREPGDHDRRPPMC